MTLPARAELVYEFLDVEWRTIQNYGVEANGQRYDGEALNGFRLQKSPYQGAHAGLWPISIDSEDVHFAYFRNPDTDEWSRLEWEHAHALTSPFSQEAADYAKRVSVRTNRHVNPSSAVHDLLGSWGRDEVLSRRDKALARRLSSQRLIDLADKTAEPLSPEEDRDEASLPAVVDLVARMPKPTALGDVVDDLDVFDRYYDEHPDEDAFEVFHE